MRPSVSLPEPLIRALRRATLNREWLRIYQEAQGQSGISFCTALLEALNVRCEVSEADLARIPAQGPVMIMANHPTGLLDGIVLGAMLPRVRSDFRFLANAVLEHFPEISSLCFFVDPFGGKGAARRNAAALKAALAWLKEGKALVTFPAGEVAHFDLKLGKINEPAWKESVIRLAQAAQAPVVPIFSTGTNSPLFHLAGLVHPRLRTLLLPHELLNKQNRTVELRVGTVVSSRKVAARQASDLAVYLRKRSLLLAKRASHWQPKTEQQEVVEETPLALIEQDLQQLPGERLLVNTGEYQAWLAHSHEIPNILRELARLRELTFRAAGEGTGASADTDEFDLRYLHLFLWHPASQKIAGAYRIGQTDVILPELGRKGLYIDSLFRIEDAFFQRLGPALELGRSFVCQEHQKSYAALLTLWKGLGRFISDHPHYRYLFGPVSISNRYLPLSRQIMVDFFNRHRRRHDLAALVKPRSPYWSWNPGVKDYTALAEGDAEEISSLLADIEKDQKGVPVLLRHYLKLGGELLAFNLDRKFSHVLDGLILVDMLGMERRMLERYMGKERAQAYLRFHQKTQAA
ncbi:MAG: lysophospholipid acyltransferase family protein [Bryobacteraceae bacterium]|nr:lysophospholipid acyltransferase family protein [Bryobacteraceae bacterium]MDW8380023.1 lysophospholipid acyltransferase family protein [Bryobacterales bacterium]